MGNKKNTDTILEMLEPHINNLGYELVEIDLIKESGQWYLRVYIDHQGGITLDDCQKVSQELDWILDEKDPIPHSYILEVSSPGAERPLKKEKDFVRFTGRKIQVSTYKPIDNQRRFKGELLGLNEAKEILLQTEDKGEISIPRENIAKANLVLEF
ncbi:ribosome maturation factor RimP [Natranaerofaba carboxydovora]|uniref:ribosome maturation factor RimP n=1 Tax=Natranaerofaba carboxydovora TaxID=2742683 RepID=UPI001F143B1D|nr:ribosome maturation factor RimP [Natranaerofaba carboxydovora]UMZ73406.1 Ribosome maturation factor RimP [Natranaerofaba carboxydovora]